MKGVQYELMSQLCLFLTSMILAAVSCCQSLLAAVSQCREIFLSCGSNIVELGHLNKLSYNVRELLNWLSEGKCDF